MHFRKQIFLISGINCVHSITINEIFYLLKVFSHEVVLLKAETFKPIYTKLIKCYLSGFGSMRDEVLRISETSTGSLCTEKDPNDYPAVQGYRNFNLGSDSRIWPEPIMQSAVIPNDDSFVSKHIDPPY